MQKFGNNISLSIFGESHGPAVGIVLEGMLPGIKVSNEEINKALSKRRPNSFETKRVEQDEFQIISGVFNCYTTGEPLCIMIPNQNVHSSDYEKVKALLRASHADYVAWEKSGGFNDYRGGGHFSGRITAGIVAAGGIIIPYLEKLGIKLGTHILKCGNVNDTNFSDYNREFDILKIKAFPVISNCELEMTQQIEKCQQDGDSIGGILQTAIVNLPCGLGDDWFDSVESRISSAIFGIGAIKGIEFGKGFGFADCKGSEVMDNLQYQDGVVVTKTNHNGGINGGITNGMPVVFNTVVKPTPSIFKPMDTINLETKTNDTLILKGRHDPAIVRRIVPVIDSVVAFVVLDLLIEKYGRDYFKKN